MQQLVFDAFIGNGDMHLKNWSMLHNPKVRPSLAPAHDFVSTIAYLSDDSVALKLSRSKQFSDFTLDELLQMTAKAMLPEKLLFDTTKATLAHSHDVCQHEKVNLSLSNKMLKAIEKYLQTVLLAIANADV